MYVNITIRNSYNLKHDVFIILVFSLCILKKYSTTFYTL